MSFLSIAMMSNAALADFILCVGGQGQDAVLVRFNTCELTAELIKQAPNLPSYRTICAPADGVLLMCQGEGGRTLFLDTPQSARYLGSRHTTQLNCQVAHSEPCSSSLPLNNPYPNNPPPNNATGNPNGNNPYPNNPSSNNPPPY